MIRSVILASFFLPALAAAASAPCGAPQLVPLPTSVPVPEMLHVAPVMASCINLQAFTDRLRQPVAAPAANAYVPKTEHDNTPWRFDMSQNGRRMTADEFDAWMKAKGIRVAKGRAPVPVPAAAAAAETAGAAPAQVQCVPTATVAC